MTILEKKSLRKKKAILSLVDKGEYSQAYALMLVEEPIDLNTTVDVRLFKGINNISNSEDANMKIRYVESIDSLVARVTALEQGQSL